MHSSCLCRVEVWNFLERYEGNEQAEDSSPLRLHPDLREKVENGTAVSSAVAQMLM